MKKLIQFYYKQEKNWFLNAVFLIFSCNLLGWLATIFYDFNQWLSSTHHHHGETSGGLRLPILLTVFFSAVLFWRINRMDISANTRTPVSFLAESEQKKLAAKFLVSYGEIAGLFLMEGLFLLLTSGGTFELTRLLLFFIILAGIIFAAISYFILLPQLIKSYTGGTTNALTNFFYGVLLILIFCMNGFLRVSFLRVYQPLLILSHSFYPVTFIFQVIVCSAIGWFYLKQKGAQLGGQKHV